MNVAFLIRSKTNSGVKKFILLAFLLWVAGTALLLLLSELLVEKASLADLLGFTSFSFLFYLLVILLVYLPVFYVLRRRGVNSRGFFWIAPLLLNIPIYYAFYLLIDKAFRSSEAVLFMALFFFFGAVFGWLYHFMLGQRQQGN